MLRIIPLGKYHKVLATSLGEAFLLLSVFPVDAGAFCSFSISRKDNLNHLILSRGISNRVDCVNGMGLGTPVFFPQEDKTIFTSGAVFLPS